MLRTLLFICAFTPGWAFAETVVATRTIRAQEIIPPDALRLDRARIEGAYADPLDVIGMEARVALYPGRPVLHGSVGRPAIVNRNQVVEIVFESGGLRITSEGRALGRGGEGDRIRVMNLGSRNVLFARILADGSVSVSGK